MNITKGSITRVAVTRSVKINTGDYSNVDIAVTLEATVPTAALLWEDALIQVSEETERALAQEIDVLMACRVRTLVEQWGDTRLTSFVNLPTDEQEDAALRLVQGIPGAGTMVALSVVRWPDVTTQWAGMTIDTAQIEARKRGIAIPDESEEPTEGQTGE